MHRQWILPLLIAVFCLTSIVGLRSIAPELASQQLLFFILGGIIFFVVASIPFWWLEKIGPYLYLGLIGSLILTLLIADPTRGSTRWINLGGIHLQFSQLAIPIVGLAASRFAARSKQRFSDFLKIVALVLVPGFFIFIQPDLGTTIVYLLSVGIIIFLSTKNPLFVWGSIGIGLLTVILSWSFLLKPYQKQRIFSFTSSQTESNDVTYNARQALIAVGSGQLYGRGLGQGVQSHLRFLPERQTDFIFASLAEELGFAGALFIISLYIAQIGIIIFIAEKAPKENQTWFCYSIVTMLTLQTGVNIGMNIGIVPITGVTLPLLSYGGSSVLSLCFSYGLVQSLVSQQKKEVVLAII